MNVSTEIFSGMKPHTSITCDTHELILDLIRRYEPCGKNFRILDAGCGTGRLGTLLKTFGDVKGIDISSKAISFAKKRGLAATRGSVERIPYKNNAFDVIVSVDVLYHKAVRDDARALSEFHRVLKPGGLVFLRLPAVSWLRRRHDAYVGTGRRYDKRELMQKLRCAGFSVRNVSYIHGILLALALCVYMMEKLFPARTTSSNITSMPPWIHDMMRILLRFERVITRCVELPLGLGLVAVAEKI